MLFKKMRFGTSHPEFKNSNGKSTHPKTPKQSFVANFQNAEKKPSPVFGQEGRQPVGKLLGFLKGFDLQSKAAGFFGHLFFSPENNEFVHPGRLTAGTYKSPI